MAMTPAGELKHIAQLQRDIGTALDGRNQRVPDWKTFARINVKLEFLSGTDLELARTIYAETTHRVTTRFYAAITREKRLFLNGKIWHIGFVENVDELNEELRLLCTVEQ